MGQNLLTLRTIIEKIYYSLFSEEMDQEKLGQENLGSRARIFSLVSQKPVILPFSVVQVPRRYGDIDCSVLWKVGELGTPKINDICMSLKSCVYKTWSSLELVTHVTGTSLPP